MKYQLSRLFPNLINPGFDVIPVVRLHGTVMASTTPMRPALSLATVAGILEKAFALPAPAVAISVNSPGGSPVQSRLIYKRIRDLAEEKQRKVLVYVEDVAASGGYMIACAGDEIIVDPSSIVGSIGVISAGFGFHEIIRKIGVERRVYTAGRNKAILDAFQPEKEEDIAHLKELQQQIHQVFIDLVKSRRGTKLADSEDLFSGLFWVGQKACDLGLADGVGDMRSDLKRRFGPKTQLRLISPVRGFLTRKIPLFGAKLPSAPDIAAELASGLLDAAEEKAAWQRFGL
ncbi:S49 family peptidase [Chelativorans composti]|uniref:S49 family peptidase n=1 Tax=Chelativorans composti TaxID=768533 RepID=A0ABW5DDD6_9HYPH